ncbi:methyltransferase family protein [Dokdonia ponticola]|uniref:Methyltransferase family protein n=1 Tax=Dokdonia ponticola TaxID=2041041 RepID=A0ABV9HYV6_9FLAO
MKRSKADIIYVLIQFVLFILFILEIAQLRFVLPDIVSTVGIIGVFIGFIIILISLLQLNKYLSPFPSPKPGSSLIQNGLYKYIRHPMYTGILMLLLGYSIYVSSGYKLLVTFLLFVLFTFKSRYEEERLAGSFKGYSGYKKKTGRFFPKIKV